MRRINFAAGLLGNTSLPGVRTMVDSLKARNPQTPAELVEGCLDVVGPIEVSDITRGELLAQAEETGELRWDTEENAKQSEQKVGLMLALIASSRDFQFA